MSSPLDPQASGPARESETEHEIVPVALAMIAKAPVAGLAKTRLCPPCSSVQAASLAEAALLDTISAMASTPAARHVVVLAGQPRSELIDTLQELGAAIGGFEIIPQRGEGLGERLSCAFADIATATLMIGMDTPQATPTLLAGGLRQLAARANDAVLGVAKDGGYWAIGLKRADARVFDGVPMSTPDTANLQRERLRLLGLRTVELCALRDVDLFKDAAEVASLAPGTRFARTLAPIVEEVMRVGA
jgi:rSAM/selenodomain-associated transferase 1